MDLKSVEEHGTMTGTESQKVFVFCDMCFKVCEWLWKKVFVRLNALELLSPPINACVTLSHQVSIACFSVHRNGFPQLHCDLPPFWIGWLHRMKREGWKWKDAVSLIGKLEEKTCLCSTYEFIYVHLLDGAGKRVHSLRLCSLWVWEAVSDTLVCSLLAPLWGRSTQASPGESGGPLGTGQDKDREERGSRMETRLSASLKRSGIKYKQNVPQYTVSLTWVGQLAERRAAEATVQWALEGQERRSERSAEPQLTMTIPSPWSKDNNHWCL